MTRSQRLLTLLQHLRDSRRAVSASALAARLGVSLRTIYRDIETLRQQGADIRGAAGTGFMLHKTDFLLPPLMFDEDEIEALVGKIHDVLPEKWTARLAAQAFYPLSGKKTATCGAAEQQALAHIRRALREQRTLHFRYTDAAGQASARTVWPIALGYFEDARLLAAWCALRRDFRHFRCDRIADAAPGASCPQPHALLLKRWQAQEKLDLLRLYGF